VIGLTLAVIGLTLAVIGLALAVFGLLVHTNNDEAESVWGDALSEAPAWLREWPSSASA
jgi:hypothetical protein